MLKVYKLGKEAELDGSTCVVSSNVLPCIICLCTASMERGGKESEFIPFEE